MNFKVGQRVRIVGCITRNHRQIVGQEGVIVRRSVIAGDWIVNIPAVHSCRPRNDDDLPPFHYRSPPEYLVPLTDPLAEQFIESLKKLAREPQPLQTEKA